MDQHLVDETRLSYANFCALLVPPKIRAERVHGAYYEFDALCQNEYVAHVAVSSQAVMVGTKILSGNTEENEIGEFLLTISKEGVTWENLTRTRKGWHAPYISYAKVACGLNSSNHQLQMHIKDGRLDRAFRLMIVMARMTPGDFPGAMIGAWPKLGASELVDVDETEQNQTPRRARGRLRKLLGRVRWLK